MAKPVIDHAAELAKAGAGVDSRLSKAWFLAKSYPLGAIGLLLFLALVFCGVFAEWIAPMDPVKTNAATSLAAPGALHALGADMMGRDMLSRIIHGARISLAVGIGSTILGCFFGVVIGLASGYLLGWFDLITQRIIDVMQALPLLVMALVMAAALGPSLENTIIAISIPLVPHVARVIRSNTLSLREMPFVEAA